MNSRERFIRTINKQKLDRKAEFVTFIH